MAKKMEEAMQKEVMGDGTVVVLETILRTPDAHTLGEITTCSLEGEQLEHPATRRISLSDLGDHSLAPLLPPMVEEPASAPKKRKQPTKAKRGK